jgi:hypothetical protein
MTDRTYTGTLIKDLHATVDAQAEITARLADEFRAKMEVIEAECDPIIYLVNVSVHLADQHVMDEGDVQAWWMLDAIKKSMIDGDDEECYHCRRIAGLHGLKSSGACKNFQTAQDFLAEKLHGASCPNELYLN